MAQRELMYGLRFLLEVSLGLDLISSSRKEEFIAWPLLA